MNRAAGYIAWTLAGALIGGGIAALLAPQFFWAAMLGGAMTAGACRVGYVLMTADDAGE